MKRLIKYKEILIVVSVFAFVLVANFIGFNTSLKRQRDIQRILDIGKIESGLKLYKEDFGEYPLSSDDGRIMACPGPETGVEMDETGKPKASLFKKPKLVGLIPCQWGKDSLLDASDINYPPYIDGIPTDPLQNKGLIYLYKSGGQGYQLLAHLELKEHKEFDILILRRKVKCGKEYCNFGREVVVK